MEVQIPGRVSLLLTGDGDEEVYAIQGRIERQRDGVVFFGNKGATIPLEDEWLERAKPITADIRNIFGDDSHCFIPLSVGTLAGGTDLSSFQSTGLNLSETPDQQH